MPACFPTKASSKRPESTGKYCLGSEGELCLWGGKKYHPEDLRTCQPLFDLLNGIRRTTDREDLWHSISVLASRRGEARSEVEAAILSPSGECLAVSLEAKNWLGLRTRQSGLLYAIRDGEAVGRIVLGKRGDQGSTDSHLRVGMSEKVVTYSRPENGDHIHFSMRSRDRDVRFLLPQPRLEP